jgi:hypothetical protein
MKISFVLIFVLISRILFSQSLSRETIISSAGYFAIKGYAQINWTLGDVAIIKLASEKNVLTQGFLQTREDEISAIGNISPDEKIQIKFYPNPVKDVLKIELSEMNREQIILDFYTIEGKKIITQNLLPFQNQTDMVLSGCKPGIYILRAQFSNGKIAESKQIIVQE